MTSCSSAPSIIIGVFVYCADRGADRTLLRAGRGRVALAPDRVPVVVRTTENMMRLVPDSLREAAAALGAPIWKVTVASVYRSALPGIMTGVLLGMLGSAGETAPLLFTALNNQFWSTDMSRPFPNLPAVIFQFAMSPYLDWQHLAWAGALLITVTVLVINIAAGFSCGQVLKAAHAITTFCPRVPKLQFRQSSELSLHPAARIRPGSPRLQRARRWRSEA